MGSGVGRVGSILGATVIVLLIPLPGTSSWLVFAGMGAVIGASLGLAGLLTLADQASSTLYAVVVAGVVAVASLGAAGVLVVTRGADLVQGLVIVVLGAVIHRVVVLGVERLVEHGRLTLLGGVVGVVGFALTACLAVIGGTTASVWTAIGIGVVVGLGEGLLAGRLLRDLLPVT